VPEPLTTIAAYPSKNGASELLGPTAEHLGEELKGLAENSQNNVASVFKKAEKKCGKKINESGVVDPIVFKHIYDERAF